MSSGEHAKPATVMRERLVGALRLALSLLTLGILVRQVGGKDLLTALRRVDLKFLGLAWALFLVGDVIRVFRWRVLLRGLGLRPPFRLLFRLYLVGGFFNSFLPSGFGGDVVRVLELGRDAENRSAALGTVVVDRLTGILSLLLMGLAVVPFAHGLAPWVRWLFVGVAVAGGATGAVLLQGRLLRRLTSFLPPPLSLEGQGKPAQVYAAVTGSGPRAIWLAMAFSTLFNATNVTVHWLCAQAVGIDLSFSFFFVVVPLLSLTLLLPISIGGLGARDWVGQMLLGPTGIAESTIAAWTLSVWAVTAGAGLIGGVTYLWQGLAGLLRQREDRIGR